MLRSLRLCNVVQIIRLLHFYFVYYKSKRNAGLRTALAEIVVFQCFKLNDMNYFY